MRHLPSIFFTVIPHHKQRYNTSGDYFATQKDLIDFRVSESTPEYEFLILIHELVEWFLIRRKGIPIAAIDKFDMDFEDARDQWDEREPGDDRKAPYYHEHQTASAIERTLAVFLGVDWHEYEAYINAMPYTKPTRRRTRIKR